MSVRITGMPRGMPSSLRRQRGIAVITAILIVTIATMLAVEIMWQTSLDLRRTENLLQRDEAEQWSLGAESLAIAVLHDDPDHGAIVHRNQPWAQHFDKDLPTGLFRACAKDLQGRFNLNNLITVSGRKDPVAYAQFQRLLAALDPPQDAKIADAVVDWIDPDTTPEPQGAEDDYYTAQTPPYRAANFWFTSPSELLAVKGITPEVYEALAPHVAALPVATKINVNTATLEVLQSLGPNVTRVDAGKWADLQYHDPFHDVTAFLAEGPTLDATMVPYLDVTSHYFGVSVVTSIGTTRLSMYSLLERGDQAVASRLRNFDIISQPDCEPQEAEGQ